jgi:tryptophanyl-tRNA synthetase
MLPGFGGAPKMSKSIPGSGVSLDMPAATIRERIIEGDGTAAPAESVVFQCMCLASSYGPEKLDRLEAACEKGGNEWARAREEYAGDVIDLAERWQRTLPVSTPERT